MKKKGEVRVGTSCSLEAQIKPGSSCLVLNFDPHVHPMWMFTALPVIDMSLTILQKPGIDISKPDGSVQFESRADQPLLNRIEFTIVDKSTSLQVAHHVLDFNQRIGYDATSTDTLDPPDKTKPYMDPLPFGSAPRYKTNVALPALFVGAYYGAAYESTLTATDTLGRSISTSW